MAGDQRPTVWILGDQLDRRRGALGGRGPDDCRVLLVESEAKIAGRRWHVQRLHVVLSAMAHLAAELEAEGFEVDHRRASSLAAGVAAHRRELGVDEVIVMEPASWDGRALVGELGVTVVPNDQFLCSYAQFDAWAGDRTRLRMEDFYRWQRRRLGVLMDGDEPVGGRWNFDHDNREPPPDDGRRWPEPSPFALDDIDQAVLDRLPDTWGDPPAGLWPVTRQQALTRLEEFIADGLPRFGPHEDAMLSGEWKLAHSVLSSSLNLGLLHPAEVVEAAVGAHDAGAAPIAGVEGFVRQVIGWREFVWGLYWRWMPHYREENQLGADLPLPPALAGDASTAMACVADVVDRVARHGYVHHIERLMVLGNLSLTAGVAPQALTDWMWTHFVDGAEWVMVPNVVGMALHADGGRMATKPYASGGAYINRMSDHCGGCAFDPRQRTGPTACPFTTLYWDFLARNRDLLAGNARMARQVAALGRLRDLDDVREHAAQVRAALAAGTL